MTDPVYVGLAVTAHRSMRRILRHATFDHINFVASAWAVENVAVVLCHPYQLG